jgi:hypothetical protein
MVTKAMLIDDGFTLEQYPDGKFWLLRKHPDLFIQVDEALTNITLYQQGWMDNDLTDDEYRTAVMVLTNGDDNEYS